MRLPRDLSGDELVARLEVFGYAVSRQRGGHIRLTTFRGGEHHITIPRHDPLKVGTLSGILSEIAQHLAIPREELLQQLF